MTEEKIDPKSLKIFSDSPIDNAKYFNFDAYIDAISRIIVNPENATPLSIVINGKWGSGKTSLMKTLRKRLDTQSGLKSGRKIRTVWFNAWKYSETDAMLASLVREIYDEIDRQNFFTKQGFFDRLKLWNLKIYERGNTTQKITDLAKALTLGLSPDFTKWQNIPEYEKNLPFFDKFQEYMRLILNFFVVQERKGDFDDTKGALIIFIDDLDRCPPKSIAKILESINLFFDQKGCIFIFGMDINLLTKAVTSHYSNYEGFSGENYIKKIIQIQFDLPDIRKEEIQEFIENELIVDDPIRNYIEFILTGSESNPRQIKQFINSLRFMTTLGQTIKRLQINEELLIKWSILNLTSGDFINAAKIQKRLFISIQSFSRLDRDWADSHDEFVKWNNEYNKEFNLLAPDAEKKEFEKNFSRYSTDKKIKKIFQLGEKEFTDENLDDYIFLSSLAPKGSDYLGVVTITAHGDGSYYVGEKVKFSGTSTAGNIVYLSIASPDTHVQTRKIDQISIATIDNDPNSFLKVEVKSDNTWQYEWDTSKVASLIKESIYTVYACEGPFTRNNLENKVYGTVSIILKKPFVSATVSQSTVAQGDRVYIRGTAEGEPKQGVQIWIFGDNICLQKIVPVNTDSSFSFELSRSDTEKLDPGQYFVVVQHPMMNNEFDIYLDSANQNVLSDYPKNGTELFSIDGPRSKKGADAAIALAEAINNPNIDDTYTKLQFLVEKPVIRFDPIGDIHIGDKFTITGTTNLAVDDEILFEFSFSDSDQLKNYREINAGVSMTVKVTKGEGGLNRLSYDIDTASFLPGKYLLSASALNLDVKAPIFFTILDK